MKAKSDLQNMLDEEAEEWAKLQAMHEEYTVRLARLTTEMAKRLRSTSAKRDDDGHSG